MKTPPHENILYDGSAAGRRFSAGLFLGIAPRTSINASPAGVDFCILLDYDRGDMRPACTFGILSCNTVEP
jgi:hypothetical protein